METAWETGGSEVSPHLVSPAPTIDMQLVGIHVEGAWLPDSIQVARTVPIYTSYYAGLQYRERLGANRFRLFDPFSYDMWLAICATAVATALIMSLLSSIETAESSICTAKADRPSLAKRVVTKVTRFAAELPEGVYNSLTALCGGFDYNHETWSGKTLRLGLLFFALVISATYTANLAAIFSEPNWKDHGPESLFDLKEAVSCFATEIGHTLRVTLGEHLTAKAIFPPTDMPLGWPRGHYCVDALRTYDADIYIGEANVLHALHLENCDSTSETSWLNVGSIMFALQVRAEDAAFANNFSRAWVHYEQTPEFLVMKDSLLQWDTHCPGSEDDLDASVSFHSMSGLFFIYGLFAVLAVLIDVYQRCTGGAYGMRRALMVRLHQHQLDQLPSKAEPAAAANISTEEIQSMLQGIHASVLREEKSTTTRPGKDMPPHADLSAVLDAMLDARFDEFSQRQAQHHQELREHHTDALRATKEHIETLMGSVQPAWQPALQQRGAGTAVKQRMVRSTSTEVEVQKTHSVVEQKTHSVVECTASFTAPSRRTDDWL